MGSLTNRSRGRRRRGRGGAAALPPPAPSPDEAGGHGIRGDAQPPPRPGARRSSLLPAARLERRRRQQASLKEKEMIVSLARSRGRRAPTPRPQARLGPPPRQQKGCRPSASAPCAHAGARRQPRRARPGAPVTPHPYSHPAFVPGHPPVAPPGPHSSPPADSGAPSAGRGWRPPGMPEPTGGPPPGRRRARAGAGGGSPQTPRHPAPPPGPAAATSPNFFSPDKLSWARPGGRCGRGFLQVSSPDFGMIRVSPPSPSPPGSRAAPPIHGAGRS
ncbi:uncharacterized protein LOC144337087 [Macaca mulatta]